MLFIGKPKGRSIMISKAHRCNACDAAPGRHQNKVKSTKKAKHKAQSISKTAAPVATVLAPAFDSQNPLAEQLDLEFSTITDVIDPTVMINESLARLFQHTSKNPSDHPDINPMRNMSGTAKDTANSGIGEGATAGATVSIGSEGATANANTTIPLCHHPALICAWIVGMPAV